MDFVQINNLCMCQVTSKIFFYMFFVLRGCVGDGGSTLNDDDSYSVLVIFIVVSG